MKFEKYKYFAKFFYCLKYLMYCFEAKSMYQSSIYWTPLGLRVSGSPRIVPWTPIQCCHFTSITRQSTSCPKLDQTASLHCLTLTDRKVGNYLQLFATLLTKQGIHGVQIYGFGTWQRKNIDSLA